MFEASAGAPPSTDDLSRATGVAERTLRNIFQEYLGVGPIRFLKAHQLRQIREALLAAEPTDDTVTGIATRFGIWISAYLHATTKPCSTNHPQMVYAVNPDEQTSAAASKCPRYLAAIYVPRLFAQRQQRGFSQRRSIKRLMLAEPEVTFDRCPVRAAMRMREAVDRQCGGRRNR